MHAVMLLITVSQFHSILLTPFFPPSRLLTFIYPWLPFPFYPSDYLYILHPTFRLLSVVTTYPTESKSYLYFYLIYYLLLFL
jgi:hypothetical protein